MSGVKIDASDFLRDLDLSKLALQAAVKAGMVDVTNDLLRVSRDLAPLDKGTLRATAGAKVDTDGNRVVGTVTYSAAEESAGGKRFNYALYMHEFGGKSAYANPTTPGTQPKYLEAPLKANSRRYRRMLAGAAKRGLRG